MFWTVIGGFIIVRRHTIQTIFWMSCRENGCIHQHNISPFFNGYDTLSRVIFSPVQPFLKTFFSLLPYLEAGELPSIIFVSGIDWCAYLFRRRRTILFYHQKMFLRKLTSKFETLYFSTLKQRQMKSLRKIFDGGLYFEIDTFLGCFWSRNMNSEVVYLDIEYPCSIFPHIWRKLYWFWK